MLTGSVDGSMTESTFDSFDDFSSDRDGFFESSGTEDCLSEETSDSVLTDDEVNNFSETEGTGRYQCKKNGDDDIVWRPAVIDFTKIDVIAPTSAPLKCVKKISAIKRSAKLVFLEDDEDVPIRRRTKRQMVEETKLEAASASAEKVLEAADGCSKLLGAHVSVAGGLERSFHNALSIGCRSFAFFVRSQYSWNSYPLKDDAVVKFKETAEEYNFPLERIVVHGSYLINAGSPDPIILGKSRNAMLDECVRCERLGIRYYNIHPGSTVGKCSREECIQTIAASINTVLKQTKSIIILIETMAGQGNTIGGTFEDLKEIIDLVEDQSRVGVCVDTCHIFAAGYDIISKADYEKTFAQFESAIGLHYLHAFHINGSRGGLGSKLDRHENIGRGALKMDAFRHLMADQRFNGIPMILETPEGDYAAEMIKLYNLLEEKH